MHGQRSIKFKEVLLFSEISQHSSTTRGRKPKEERSQNTLAPHQTAGINKYEVNHAPFNQDCCLGFSVGEAGNGNLCY
jgi:hypothetical protein